MSLTTELPAPIRVLIADDSAVMRTALSRMLDASPQIRVCGTARNGQEVVEKTKLLQPDVITMDVEMPVLNGVEALKRIMSECPRPVIMVSSATCAGAEVTLEALAAGAFDYLSKENFHPGMEAFQMGADLIQKIEAASHSRLARERAAQAPLPSSLLHFTVADRSRVVPRIVVLGTSTGGPSALQELLPELPGDLPVSMIVIQHMPPGFTAPFAQRLDGLSRVKVCEAQHGEALTPGTVYIAPAGPHTTVTQEGSRVYINLTDTPSGTPHKPSVDVAMLSVAEIFGAYAMGIILTGMGSDGLQGMTAIHQAGGLTIGQDEASSVVYGMPRACAEHGVLDRVVPLQNVPGHILQAINYRVRM
jgi:two-component system, chemotaxis family, protein-glutamate methylesterase/glutaminase